jgi:hypothetical protein
VHFIGIIVCAFISRMLVKINLPVILNVYAFPIAIFSSLVVVVRLFEIYVGVSGFVFVSVFTLLLFALNIVLLKLFDPEFVDEMFLVLGCRRWVRG